MTARTVGRGLLTVAEVARIFRSDPNTVRTWVQRGLLVKAGTPGTHLRIFEDSVRARFGSAWTGDGPPPPLLTPPEVAAEWRVHPVTVARWGRSGRVTVVRTPAGHMRFVAAEITAGVKAELAPGIVVEVTP